MRNRKLEVRMVKTNKNETPSVSQNEITFEGKVAIIGHYLERGFRMAGKAALAYVVLDTFRQVAIAQANQQK